MTAVDPLDAISDPARRAQLALFRALDGAVRSSDELRSTLAGFRSQKGIYKPRGSPYALWIRETRRGAYPDKQLVVRPDGSWEYDYAPEGRHGKTDLTLATNRALLKCLEDRVPVGVVRQIPGSGRGRLYEVAGLGYVTGFDGAHFRLRGEPIDVSEPPTIAPADFRFEPFDRVAPTLALTLRRNREERFRLAIRRVYHERCSLCNIGYRVGRTPLAIQAAHLIPFEDGGTSKDVRNGILLCSNHHALFDRFAWTFDEELRIRVTDDRGFRASAARNHILQLDGHRLSNLPDLDQDRPDPVAIRYRMEMFERNQ